MSSFTFADNKLGGRLTAACDAIGQGHLRRAAGIFNELAEQLNVEAENTDGLLADVLELDQPVNPPPPVQPPPSQPSLTMMQPDQFALDRCRNGSHSWGSTDPVSGWTTCQVCGYVVVTPPADGPIDMGNRALGDL